MTPTAVLPVAAAAPSAATAPAAATATAPAAGASGTQEFMLMLGQLLGVAAPTPAAAAQTTTPVAATDTDTDSTELLDSAALEAMLPFVLGAAVNVPTTPAPTAASGAAESLDITAMISSGGSPATRSVIESLTGALAATAEAAPGDAAMFANLNASATTSAVDDLQNLRATHSSDPGRGLHTPVGSSEWADELGTRLTWMAERGHQTASLRLSPEHLGPLEIRITIRDDQASVWFGAAHADTRAAIEQALPRLRELFVAQGLSLADAGVSHEAPRDQSRPQHGPGAHGDAASHADGEANVVSSGHRRLGLVDAYA